MSREEELLKAYRKRFEQKIRETEIEVIDYWREKLDRLIAMRPDGIASLQAEMKKMSQMMKNRVAALKREAD